MNEVLPLRTPRPSAPRRLAAIALLLVLQAAAGCSLPHRGPVQLSILATSDFHGALESDVKDPATGRVLGGAAALAATIERERQRNPAGTLLLDAGDIIQGSAISNLTRGRTSIDFFNTLGFDAAVIGNHEFDWGVETLGERIAQARFPFLLANVEEKSTGRAPSWARAYQIVERQGIRIAVIGLATETLAQETLPRNVEAYRFTDPVATAERLVGELVPARADLAVLVCHYGLSKGDIFGTELKETAARVGSAAAIVGGHTHEQHAERLAGVPMVQPGRGGQHLGRIDLVFDPATRRVSEQQVELVPVFADAVTPDPEMVRRLAGYRAEVDTVLAEEIGTAGVELDHDPNREGRLGNLLTDVVRTTLGVDIALQNALGVRAPIAAGTIRYGDVYKALPFDNTVVLLPMTGAQIARLFAESDAENRLIFASGLRYAKDLSRPAGQRIEIVTDLDPERTYRVAINNYMAQGGAGFTSLAGLASTDTGVVLRDMLADWIRGQTGKGSPVRAEIDGRILIKE